MFKTFANFGKYVLLMQRVFAVPQRWRVFFKQVVQETYKLGVDSLGIAIIISVFIGAVITMQVSINIMSPLIPRFTVGFITCQTILLEFSSSILCLILAGKVGANIASEIGMMRVTEQIDALEIMGINSANYLILPKIVAFVLFVPVLVIFSMFFGVLGGYCICWFTDIVSVPTYEYGIRYSFIPNFVFYSLLKAMVFAFIIASSAAYFGYYVKGSARNVGEASMNAVVNSNVLILASDVLITLLYI
ncbi:MlaE family ABC transporter permease [Candidatus Symbiothrix dinenymphae]|uniref:MlaE family ABC transporter permease n=1 Tax=Candidatus Symbiothrix dinenymphae TaxID=467085 RepID=UPI0006C47E99|nr:ABC transporter permease [Candidatus Symbiothrix dinenymphae]GAP73115.1 hypothetical protein SAMD00024442_6_90 [Candidatus Symbiothrix dinenymphae]